MLNKERPEVIDAAFDSVINGGTSPLSYFCKTMNIGLKTKFQLIHWLELECHEPFKITQVEKYLLEYLSPYHMSIERNAEGRLLIYSSYDCCESFHMFNDLFKFIEPNECYEIKDILENCEVVEHE